jgi:hypothetical protein
MARGAAIIMNPDRHLAAWLRQRLERALFLDVDRHAELVALLARLETAP